MTTSPARSWWTRDGWRQLADRAGAVEHAAGNLVRQLGDAVSVIHSCSCGARIRLPSVTTHTVFRCPKCKAQIFASPDASGAPAASPVESSAPPFAPAAEPAAAPSAPLVDMATTSLSGAQ